jgi:hypothetical protein
MIFSHILASSYAERHRLHVSEGVSYVGEWDVADRTIHKSDYIVAFADIQPVALAHPSSIASSCLAIDSERI